MNTVDLLKRLILSQFEDKPVFYGFCESVFEEFQPSFDTLEECRSVFDIQTQVGKQLDIIGGLFSVGREGDSDEEYRQRIKQAISENTFGVTRNNIINTTKTVSGAESAIVFEHNSGTVVVFLTTPFNSKVADIVDSITAAGVKGVAFFTQEPLDVNKGCLYHHNDIDNLIASPYALDGIGWGLGTATLLKNSAIGPDGVPLSADELEDTSTTEHQRRSYTLTVEPNSEYVVTCFVSKQTVSQVARITIYSRGVDPTSVFTIDVNLLTGDSDTNLLEGPDYYCVTKRIVTSNHSSLEVDLAPAVGTTLGVLDVAVTGKAAFWGVSVLNVDGFANAKQQPLIPSSFVTNEYLIVDENGNFIVDESLNNILGINREVYTLKDTYLSIPEFEHNSSLVTVK